MHLSIRRTLDPIEEPISLEDMKNYLRVDIEEDDSLIASLISLARERAEDVTSRGLLEQEYTLTLDRFPVRHGYFYSQGSYHRHYSDHRVHQHIILPRGPVLAVTSVKYIDLSGTEQTLDPAQYAVDTQSLPARIAPVPGRCWPVAQCEALNAVTIKFTVGHQQTAIETVTLPTEAPFEVPVTRADKSLALLACIDADSLETVTATLDDGNLIVPSGTSGQNLVVTYTVSSIPQGIIHAINLIAGNYYENRAEVVQGGGNFNKLPLTDGVTALLGINDLFPLGLPEA